MSTPFVAGAVRFPLPPAAPGRSLLRDADPALFFLLDYFSWSVRTYAGARLLAEAAELGLHWSDAVAGCAPFDPREYLLEHQAGFPLLALYRVSSTFSDFTVAQRSDITQLELAFVLPPLSPAQRERLGPILHAVKALIAHRAAAGWDADYTPPGGTLGAQMFSQLTAGLSDLSVTAARFGGFVDSELVFPSVVLQLEVSENACLDEADLPPFFAQMDVSPDGHAGLSGGPVPHQFVLSHVSPAQGPLAGGGACVLRGEGLVPGTMVSFGNVSAQTLSHDDAQEITVRVPRAPAHAALLPEPLRVDVTAHSPAGVVARLPAAYTYTP